MSIILTRSKATDQHCLVTSLSTREDTQLILIDPEDGRLKYSNSPGIDTFSCEGEALDFLADVDPYEILERGVALLGYAAIGSAGLVLLATRTRPAAALPGGHVVRLVTESRWVNVPLQDGGRRLTPEEAERVDMVPNFSLNNAHFYCETADVSRGFPSARPAGAPSWEFVWNRWLATPLRAAGLPAHCPHLLQGVVEARTLQDATGRRFTLVLLARRSRLHPGMRYIARGLNALASPGNEIDFLWRRGTVPIWWGVELRSGGVGEANIVVSPSRPYRGTRRYFRRLQKRYAPDPAVASALGAAAEAADCAASSGNGVDGGGAEEGGDADEDGDASLRVPVACINLLRCNMQRKDELLLSEHFAEGVRRARRRCAGAPLRVLNFDWHGMTKDLRERGAVEGLWALLVSIVAEGGVSVGTLEPGECRRSGFGTCAETPWPGGWRARWEAQQRGCVRFNCADSLDRTNAASYFCAVQVLAEQCRRLGLNIESPAAAAAATNGARERGGGAGQGNSNGKPRDPAALDISSIHRRVRDLMLAKGDRSGDPPSYSGNDTLPAGWEARKDAASGRTFFIDHNTRATTWDQAAANGEPAPAKTQAKWGLFGLSVDEVRARLRSDLVAAHAEVFLINGDMNSALYTSSRAMHSAVLGLLQGDSGGMAKSSVGRLQNLSVSVQRRWNNVLSDATRQVVVEMFLGLRLGAHFPSARIPYTDDLPLEGESDAGDSEESDEPLLPPAARQAGMEPLASEAALRSEARPAARSALLAVSCSQKRYVSWYRGATLLCTCVAILAVDFTAFPRRFAKSRTYGTSVMDVGVGCAIFASALVAKEARQEAPRAARAGICTALRQSATLLALGGARALLTQVTDYSVNAAEYGEHCNFYLILAVLSLLKARARLPPRWLLPAGAAVAAMHQAALSAGLIGVIHAEEGGSSLLSRNKEGVFSLPGYWALSLMSTGLARLVHGSAAAAAAAAARGSLSHGRALRRWLLRLACTDAVLWVVYAVLAAMQPASRRACNAAYAAWLLALNLLLLLALACVDALCSALEPALDQLASGGPFAAGADAEAAGTAHNRFELLSVTIRKPLGLVLAEAPAGPRSVVVESIAEGGNAAKSGIVRVGDFINRCSATVLKAGKDGEYEREGYGQRPYDNWETVMFDCKDQDFKTVLAAIGSNNERWGINKVTLELRRPVTDF
ncbi:hypothetical protein WJX81_000601 [Elliptochloris bilobata]|uniref:WW domain-containing protein n=1 Tax=Elliptochloris bilobata TaxID=381761 RepID=A0AAW1R046_9CHLO